MNRFFSTIVMMLCLIGTTSCAQPQKTQVQLSTDEEEQLRQDIGEMLLVGFRGLEIDGDHHIVRDIKEYNIGGVILFEYDVPSKKHHRNIESPKQVAQLCGDLQKLSPETLLISIDQEGGFVRRLKPADGFQDIISAKKQAAKGDDTIRHYARLTSEMLHSLGINLNFAPCVDVDVNPDCPVIGRIERSFGSKPNQVVSAASIWLEESQKASVAACLKHFPGHGSSGKDSHLGLVDVTRTWKTYELEPYRQLIAAGNVPMIMTTHVINGQLDTCPATLSSAILTGILRHDLGFDGVIITDDMGMGAIAKEYPYPEAIRKTILAGADMLCIGNNGANYNPDIVPETFEIIRQMVLDGTVGPQRIHESAERIRLLKRNLNSSK